MKQLALVLFVLAFAVFPGLAAPSEAAPPPPNPFVGHWFSINPDPTADNAAMDISGGRRVSVRIEDDRDDRFCGNGPASGRGHGSLTGVNELTVDFLWRCLDDGSVSHQTLVFLYNPGNDQICVVPCGLVWHRVP